MMIVGDACYICVVALALALARVTNYVPRVMLQIVVSLTNNSRGVFFVKNASHRSRFCILLINNLAKHLKLKIKYKSKYLFI
jgi:hypothetical protein